MSGRHFDYQQFTISDIENQIQELIDNNNSTALDEWGAKIGRGYSPETIAKFEKAVACLQQAFVYVQRIDWLVSRDEGEDTFHERLADELQKLKEIEKKLEKLSKPTEKKENKASRVAIELVSGPIAGAFLGYIIDNILSELRSKIRNTTDFTNIKRTIKDLTFYGRILTSQS